MSYIIRRMELCDVDEVLYIEKSCFPDPWSRKSLEYEVTKNDAALYFVGIEMERIFGQSEKNSRVIAYAGLWVIADEGHITNIAVLPEYRGQKKGQLLVTKMMDEAKLLGVLHFTLEVKTTNIGAIAMYEKIGFQVEGIRRNYYEYDNADAYIMWHHSK